jgi:hypothetical protein
MKKFDKINLAFSSALLLIPGVSLAAVEGSITPIDGGVWTVAAILERVTNWVLGFTGLVAIMFLVYGGLQYIISAGNKDKAEAAKKTILYAVIGLVVVALSYVIVSFVTTNVKDLS